MCFRVYTIHKFSLLEKCAYMAIYRAVAAFLKVVRRRKSSSADSTRGGRAREGDSLVRGDRGSPREIFDFLALLCASLMGFYAFRTDQISVTIFC